MIDGVPSGWVVTLATLHPSWRHHTHRGSVVVPKMRVVDGLEISDRFHFATIEIGCFLATVTGYVQGSAAGARVAEWITNGLMTSYPAMHRLDPGKGVALLPAWNPPTEDAIDSLVVEFAGTMYDLGN